MERGNGGQWWLPALLVGLATAAPGQVARFNESTVSHCTSVATSADSKQCLSSVNPFKATPTLQADHVYTLPELVDIAETASPEGRIAWAESKRAFEQTGIAAAQYLPLLTFAAQATHARSIVPFAKPLAPEGFVVVDTPILAAQFELQYSLLDPARRPRIEQARALQIASSLRLGRTHQTIAFATATGYYKVQEALGRSEAASTILKTAQTLQENTQAQFDNGRATLPDLQSVEARTAEARYNLTQAQADVKRAKLALTEAIGVEPTTEVQIAAQETGDSQDSFNSSVEELLHAAWKARPDLLAAAQEVSRAHHGVAEAHAAYRPSIGVAATAGPTSMWPTANYGELGPASVATWAVTAQLRWNLFDGARRHQLEAARAEQKAAEERQRASQDAVTRQVWEAYVDYETAREQEKAAGTFLKSAQVSYDSSLDAFKYGVRSLVDVVQAERQLAQARQDSVRARAALLQSQVGLSYATGELIRNNNSSNAVHN